jgi:hypothetical protein
MLGTNRRLVDRCGVRQRIEDDVGDLGGVVVGQHLRGRERQRALAAHLDRRPGLIGLGRLVVELRIVLAGAGLGADAVGGVIARIGDDRLFRHVERGGVFLCHRNGIRFGVERDTDVIDRERPERSGLAWEERLDTIDLRPIDEVDAGKILDDAAWWCPGAIAIAIDLCWEPRRRRRSVRQNGIPPQERPTGERAPPGRGGDTKGVSSLNPSHAS